eukprot:359861-Prorocentrum_minimum.AAC.2
MSSISSSALVLLPRLPPEAVGAASRREVSVASVASGIDSFASSSTVSGMDGTGWFHPSIVFFFPLAPVWGDQFNACSTVARGRGTAVKVTYCAGQNPKSDVQKRANRVVGSGSVARVCRWGGRCGVYDHLWGRCCIRLRHLSRGQLQWYSGGKGRVISFVGGGSGGNRRNGRAQFGQPLGGRCEH